MRSALVTLVLGILLLPGAQHGFADLIDARHGLHGHCHLVFVEAHAHEAHAHEAHAHEAHAHEAHAHEAHDDVLEAGIAAPRDTSTHLVLPRDCSAPASDVPCPHAPLEGPGHHSHASPPMLCAPPLGTLSSWAAGRGLTFGARAQQLHARSSERPLERPPRV